MLIHRLGVLLSLMLVACEPAGDKNPFEKQLQEPPFGELTRLIDRSPKNDSLYFERALLLLQQDQPAAAQLDLEKAWTLRPTTAYALALAGQLSTSTPDQLKFLKEATTRLPEQFELEWALADTYQRSEQSAEALRLTEKWVKKGARDPEFILLHIRLLKENKRNKEALSTLEALFEMYPTQRTIQEMLALQYAESGNEKVKRICEQMSAADSGHTDPLPHYYLGIYLETQKQYAQALKQFDRVIQIDYHFVEAYVEKASVLYEQKKWSTALDVLGKALAVAPDQAAVYYWSAKCQQAMGDKESARLNYLKAYGLDKTFMEAKQAADQLK